MNICEDLLSILVCPKCQKKLEPSETGLDCKNCSLSYPVNDDTPVLLIDAAATIKAK